MSCPYGHTQCHGRGFCGIERWGWRDRRTLIRGNGGYVFLDASDGGAWALVFRPRRWRKVRP